MDLAILLHDAGDEVLAAANLAAERMPPINELRQDKEHTHQRLKALFVLTTRAVKERNLGPMIAYAETIARERFNNGQDITGLQTACNVLEEAIWTRIVRSMPPDEYGEALGLVSTVLGAGKETIARTYVTLASKSRAKSLNLRSQFAGTEGA